MQKIKVINILRSLSKEELRQLDKFVRSPVHNRHERVISLFKILRSYLPNRIENLKSEKLFHALFPNEPVNLQKMHHVSSYLLKVVEEFLAWREWKKNDTDFNYYLLKAFHSHRLNQAFQKSIDQLRANLGEMPIRDSTFLRQKFMLEEEWFNHARTISNNRDFRLQELSDALDVSFIAEKLKTACILLSNQAVIKTEYDIGLLDEILAYLENHHLLEFPAISVYYHACRTLSNFEDDVSFQKLKEQLSEHGGKFTSQELYDLYIFAINYCIRRINKGEAVFMEKVFELYKTGMDSEIFIQSGVIPPRTYSNIVMAGLRSHAYEWIEKFIFKYKNTLPENQRDGFFNYNLARLYFEKNDYSKAMPLLLQMEYDDILLTCLGKILLAQMYFEQKETEALNSLLQSFKIYIKRKKMLGYHRESYLNFINLLGKLNLYKNEKNNINIKSEILKTKRVAEKEWLLGQIIE